MTSPAISDLNPARITMYGAEWCGDCRRSKALLDRRGVDYDYVDLEVVSSTAPTVRRRSAAAPRSPSSSSPTAPTSPSRPTRSSPRSSTRPSPRSTGSGVGEAAGAAAPLLQRGNDLRRPQLEPRPVVGRLGEVRDDVVEAELAAFVELRDDLLGRADARRSGCGSPRCSARSSRARGTARRAPRCASSRRCDVRGIRADHGVEVRRARDRVEVGAERLAVPAQHVALVRELLEAAREVRVLTRTSPRSSASPSRRRRRPRWGCRPPAAAAAARSRRRPGSSSPSRVARAGRPRLVHDLDALAKACEPLGAPAGSRSRRRATRARTSRRRCPSRRVRPRSRRPSRRPSRGRPGCGSSCTCTSGRGARATWSRAYADIRRPCLVRRLGRARRRAPCGSGRTPRSTPTDRLRRTRRGRASPAQCSAGSMPTRS